MACIYWSFLVLEQRHVKGQMYFCNVYIIRCDHDSPAASDTWYIFLQQCKCKLLCVSRTITAWPSVIWSQLTATKYKEWLLVLISPEINSVDLKQKQWMLEESYCADVLKNKFLSVKLIKLLVLKNLLRKETVLQFHKYNTAALRTQLYCSLQFAKTTIISKSRHFCDLRVRMHKDTGKW